MDKSFLCPVCGYPLNFQPWHGDLPSDDICSSCGIQFGLDDGAARSSEKRQVLYSKLRQRWTDNGMKWWSTKPTPSHWNPIEQLKGIGIGLNSRQ